MPVLPVFLGIFRVREEIPDINPFPVKMNMDDQPVSISLDVNDLNDSSALDLALIRVIEGGF